MKRPFGARTGHTVRRPKYWIAASLKSEGAVFGSRAKAKSNGDNLRFLGSQCRLRRATLTSALTFQNGSHVCGRARTATSATVMLRCTVEPADLCFPILATFFLI